MRTFVRGAAAAILVICASACGGGGGGNPANPVLGSLMFSTGENAALSVQLTATDPAGGTLTFTQNGSPKSGTVTGFTAAGAFVYQPNANFTGSDSFPIKVVDAAGHTSTGTVSIAVKVNHAPITGNTIVRADGAALASINVLTNASDPDGDKLTVAITAQPAVGTATVNSDGSVSITGLPSDFKGLTRFNYTVTDPSGAAASAVAAVFVGADPFRAAFVGDAMANGAYEVYLTDFAAAPVAVTAATQGNLRLKGFAAADNGATVAYRVQDMTTATTTSLSFVETATPSQQVGIPLPGGATPVLDAQGKDQFRVSPDGQWIALIAGAGGTNSLYVVNVASPTVVSQVAPAGAVYMTQPTFSPDSKNIYFLATGVASGAAKSLYFAVLSSPGATALVSAASDPATSDDVSAYSVAEDQSKIVVQANRGGRVGLYFIDPTHLQTENQINQTPLFGQVIAGSTISLPPGKGGSSSGSRVAYTVENSSNSALVGAYVAEVSTTPNPRLVAPGVQALGLRPDNLALLYSDGAQVSEAVIDSGTAAQPVGGGSNAWYDSTGNIVLLSQALPSGGSPPDYPALASTVRGSFGTTQRVGSGGMAADYVNVTGFDRGVAIIGEGPTTGAAPTTAQLALVNALAPTSLFYLASFNSPLQLTSDSAKVVTD